MSCLLAKIGCAQAKKLEIISDSPHLNKWYLIDPKKEASSYQNRALKSYLIGAICLVAAVVFASSFVIFSLLATAGAATPLWVQLGSLLAIPSFYVGLSRWTQGQAYAHKAEEESLLVEIHSELINKEQKGEINFYNEPFFEACEIERPNHETLKNLIQHLPYRSASADKAQKAWLLVLARFLMTCEQVKNVKNEHSYSDLASLSISERNDLYTKNWNYREAQLYPRVLEAALLLHILKNPLTNTSSLDNLGDLSIKPYAARVCDQKRLGNNDYFIFRSPGKESIKLDERIKIVKRGICSQAFTQNPASAAAFSENFKSLQAHLVG